MKMKAILLNFDGPNFSIHSIYLIPTEKDKMPTSESELLGFMQRPTHVWSKDLNPNTCIWEKKIKKNCDDNLYFRFYSQ